MDLSQFWNDLKDEMADSKGAPAGSLSASKGAPLPGPAGGIMGPPAAAQTQFTDLSQQGLMNPRYGQGPRDLSQGASAKMQPMPGPTQRGLGGLMGMAPRPQQREQKEMPDIKMNEYLRGLLYG